MSFGNPILTMTSLLPLEGGHLTQRYSPITALAAF